MTCACDVCEDGFEKNAAGECVEANPCGDGQVSVTNYDSAGNNIGKVCCEVEADYENNSSGNIYETRSNYKVDGAINGSCCGGYSDWREWFVSGGERYDREISSSKYKIWVNGGVTYCGIDTLTWRAKNENCPEINVKYFSASKWCQANGQCSPYTYNCSCSETGDPQKNGSSCNP